MKGCIGLLVLLVLVAVGGYVFLLFTPMRGTIGLPIGAAVLTTFSLGILWGALLSVRKRRAHRPPSTWRDGNLVAFSGAIQAGQEPLAAPASGKACAIYEYSLRHDPPYKNRAGTSHSAGQTSGVAAYDGMGMAACTVQGGGDGFRLIGFPLLAHVPKSYASSPDDLRRMAAHLLGSTIQPKPAGLGSALRTLRDILADADGVVRHDQACAGAFDLTAFQARHATDPETAIDALASELRQNDYRVEETVIPQGAEVTVYGKFRAADRVIDVGSGMSSLEHGLFLGSPKTVWRRDLRWSLIWLVLLLPLTIGLYWKFGRALWPAVQPTLYEDTTVRTEDALAAIIRPSHAAEMLVQLAQNDDAEAIRLLLRLGADPNVVVHGDVEPLQQALHPDAVRALLEGGADPNIADHTGTTPLHRFTEMGDVDTVKLLLQHGARVDTTDEYGNTALHRAAVTGEAAVAVALLEAKSNPNARARDGSTPLDEARANGHDAIVELLVRGGSAETEVTAENGTAIRPGDPPLRVVDAYLAALHARDSATMILLDAAASAVDWSTVDWDVLQSSWPTAGEVVEGFANDQRATVRLRGVVSDGSSSLPVGFALERNPAIPFDDPLAAYGGWRIIRSWIEWGEAQ
jgi:hypothetical protein